MMIWEIIWDVNFTNSNTNFPLMSKNITIHFLLKLMIAQWSAWNRDNEFFMQIIFQYLFFTRLTIIRFSSTYTKCPLLWNIIAYWYFIIEIKISHIFYFSFWTDRFWLFYIVLGIVNTFNDIASDNKDRKLYNLVLTGNNMNEICSNKSMM